MEERFALRYRSRISFNPARVAMSAPWSGGGAVGASIPAPPVRECVTETSRHDHRAAASFPYAELSRIEANEGAVVEMQNMNIIVTGGASGIGRATALLLAKDGAHVFVGDIDAAGGQAVQLEATQQGWRLTYLPLDLTEVASIAAFVVSVNAQTASIEGLVNAAGWDKVEPFMDNDPLLWERLIAINLLGPIRLTRQVLTRMVEARHGKIVNISSDAGRVGSTGETVYSATKGGVIAFTKALAREMARYRVNVNCVCPGPTNTPLLHSQTSEWALKIRQGLTSAIPFRRLAEPAEIADAIQFFLSPRSAFVTGQVLSVSGGLTMAG